MDSKEIQRQFKAAAWPTPQALEMFVMAAEVVPAAELQKLLAMLLDKGLSSDMTAHRNRLQAFKRLVESAPDSNLFIPFVRTLKAADMGTRTLLVELLPKVNHVPGHAELGGLLKQPDIGLRRAAVAVMRNIAGKSIFDLCMSLGKEDHPGRGDAIELAATIGSYHAIPMLEYVVMYGKAPERLLALKYLGDLKLMGKDTVGAVAAIGRALGDPNDQIHLAALTAFGAVCSEEEFHVRMGPYLDTEGVSIPKVVIDSARRFPSPRTFAMLERRFRMGPNALRLVVLSTLETIGNDDSLPLLAEALAIKNVQVRQRAGEVLSTLSINKKINLARTLLWLLRSRDVNVRRMAVDVAKKVGDPNGELWPALLRFLRDEDWWVRERVMDALVEMAGTQLTRHIVGYLQDSSDVVRRYAVDVLMRLKDPASLGSLVRTAMADTDWWVRERAIESIALINDPRAVPYIVDLMTKVDELRLSCLDALARMNAKAAASAVIPFLTSYDLDVRKMSLECLIKIGGPEHGEAVQVCLQDEDHIVRGKAKDLLAQWNFSQLSAEDMAARLALSALDRLLVGLAQAEGDDLILSAGRQPYIKKMGKVIPLEGTEVLTPEGLRDLLWPVLTELQRTSLENRQDIDFSHDVKTEGLRFRANLFNQHSGLGAVFRIVKNQLMRIESLGLPPVIQTFGDLKNGLVLVGGPTGSGKSTTLAAIIDYINRTSSRHIVSLEDPIEVLHAAKQSLVNQREVGTHTRSFQTALRSVLREDPDVLLVGEMRDLATISFAVTAAETGHLVFGTLHTVSADTTMDRLINAFPAGQQAQVRSMLAESLRAVVCQHLLRRKDQPGRALALEIMVNNDAISNLIRKGKSFQIPSMIATGREQGMQSMDWDLKRLVKEGIVSPEEAFMKANNKKEFEDVVNGKDGTVAPPPPANAASTALRALQPNTIPGGVPGAPATGTFRAVPPNAATIPSSPPTGLNRTIPPPATPAIPGQLPQTGLHRAIPPPPGTVAPAQPPQTGVHRAVSIGGAPSVAPTSPPTSAPSAPPSGKWPPLNRPPNR
jgi:twitching motility protein PilT